MRLLHRLGWPLTYLGLVVVLAAILSYIIRDSALEQQWLQVAATSWRTAAPDAIAQQRAELHMWPGVLAGVGLTVLGILLLELRRRTWDGGVEREEMEGRFEDGRPVVFKPPEDEPDE